MRSRWLASALVLTYASVSAADLSPTEKARRDVAVATVGERTITLGQLEDRLAIMPDFQREEYGSTDHEVQKNVLERVLVREALFAESARRNEGDPLLRYELGRARANATLREIAKTVSEPAKIPETEVSAYYEAHLTEYQSPLRIHAWRILLSSQAEAERVLEEAKAAGTPDGWSKLCRESSVDEATKLRRGTLGFLSPDGSSSVTGVKAPKEHYEALLTVQDGEIVPKVLPEGAQFAVLWRRGSTPAKTQTLTTATPEIRRILYDTRFREAREARVKALRDAHVRDVDTTLLNSFSVDIGSGVINVHPHEQQR